jgi:phosphomethylpyrimidine synthase
MTQLEYARRGEITAAMKTVAATEVVDVAVVCEQVALGHAVIPANPAHANLVPQGVGRLFRTKINANLGRSATHSSIDEELEKLRFAIDAGAEFVMDLSVGEGLADLRRAMIAASTAPLGTVPIYEALDRVGGDASRLDEALLLAVIRDQAEQGVDFMTLHAGLLRRHIPLAMKRKLGIVSRGGAIMGKWMHDKEKENPLYTAWDAVMAICREHDVTVSLGDALRPGCLADASDEAQFAELDVLGELVLTCREAGVQVFVEGPGHIPFDQIQMNMERQQEVCDNAPFYVLGPVVTDVAPGYDHITSAIGATAAATYGASLLCYVTPSEHLSLPDCQDVRDGVAAYRIAAHAGDVARGLPGARDWDDAMADARGKFDWNLQFELAIDGDEARRRYEKGRDMTAEDSDYCSMCGRDFCAMRNSQQIMAG